MVNSAEIKHVMCTQIKLVDLLEMKFSYFEYYGGAIEIQFTEKGFGYLYETLRFGTNKPEYSFSDFTSMYRRMKRLAMVTDTDNASFNDYCEETINRINVLLSAVNEALMKRTCTLHMKSLEVIGVSRKQFYNHGFSNTFAAKLAETGVIDYVEDVSIDDDAIRFSIALNEYNPNKQIGDVFIQVIDGIQGRTPLSMAVTFKFQDKTYQVDSEIEVRHLNNMYAISDLMIKRIEEIWEAKCLEALSKKNGIIVAETMMDNQYEIGKTTKDYEKIEDMSDSVYGKDGIEALANLNKDYADKHGYKGIFKKVMDVVLKDMFHKAMSQVY
jgi:hypothetical protein